MKATAAKTGYVSGVSTSNGILATPGPGGHPDHHAVDHRCAGGQGEAHRRHRRLAGAGSKTYAYQWFVNGQAVAKETAKTYMVRTRDAGLP